MREEIGWPRLVQTIAGGRGALKRGNHASATTAGRDRWNCRVRRIGCRLLINLTNSAWLRDYPTQQRTALHVMGVWQEDVNDIVAALPTGSAHRELEMRSQ
ncbi:MAG TPA: hypothetical protein VI320_12760 [Terracidiphilus sp.]